MDKARILLQLDTDPLPSVFDRVVAIDAGVEELFSYGGVKPEQVKGLVHGLIFTRGPKDLHRSAVFIGGSDIDAGELLLREVRKALIPSYGLSVSVCLDSNGANSTAAAAVFYASKHLDLSKTTTLILGGTGPVGKRAARLLAKQGGTVRIGSRALDRAEAVASPLRAEFPTANVLAVAVSSSSDAPNALDGCQLVIGAGAAGMVLLPKKIRENAKTLRVAIDLNGEPPAGIEGVEATDKAVERDGIVCYGALGVGGLKMKIHKAMIAGLFESNTRTYNIDEAFAAAQSL